MIVEFLSHFLFSLQVNENKENIETNEDDVPTFGDGVECINIEPYLRKTAGTITIHQFFVFTNFNSALHVLLYVTLCPF